MIEIFWGCFAFGVLFTLVSVVLGDLISSALDGALDFLSVDFLNPMVLATGITVFGGTGIMLAQYSAWSIVLAVPVALGAAFLVAYVVYRWYVRPMNNSENSSGYSMGGLVGRLGEVITTIPEKGYGEVLVRVGAGNTNHMAGSFNREVIHAGTRVVVVEVKDGALYVTRFENIE